MKKLSDVVRFGSTFNIIGANALDLDSLLDVPNDQYLRDRLFIALGSTDSKTFRCRIDNTIMDCGDCPMYIEPEGRGMEWGCQRDTRKNVCARNADVLYRDCRKSSGWSLKVQLGCSRCPYNIKEPGLGFGLCGAGLLATTWNDKNSKLDQRAYTDIMRELGRRGIKFLPSVIG